MDKLLKVHKDRAAQPVSMLYHTALPPGSAAPAHTNWAHTPHMEKTLHLERDYWIEAQGNEGRWGQPEFTEGEISEWGHQYEAGGTARGTSTVEEAEYFFKGAGCEAWEKSQWKKWEEKQQG